MKKTETSISLTINSNIPKKMAKAMQIAYRKPIEKSPLYGLCIYNELEECESDVRIIEHFNIDESFIKHLKYEK